MTQLSPFDYEVNDAVIAIHEEGKARGDTDEQIAQATRDYLGSNYVRYQMELERHKKPELTVINGGKD